MMKLVLVLVLSSLAACGGVDPSPQEACREIEYRLCDAVKECSLTGDAVTACIQHRDEICVDATAAPSEAQLGDCLGHLQDHGCNGGMPTFDAAGTACLAMYR